MRVGISHTATCCLQISGSADNLLAVKQQEVATGLRPPNRRHSLLLPGEFQFGHFYL